MLGSTLSVQAKAILTPMTVEQGLSQGSVRDLLLDRHGFLWIATTGGINRFDGNQLTELHAKHHRLSEISFNDILEDSQGRLWLTADHTGLYLYDAITGNFELFLTAPQEYEHAIDSTILKLIERDENHLLFVVNQAIYQLRISDKALTKLFDLEDLGFPNGWIRNLLLHHNQLFIAAFNGLIHLDLSNGRYQYLPHLPAAITAPSRNQLHTKSLFMTDASLYVGTVEGLYSIARADIDAFLATKRPYNSRAVLAERNIWQIQPDQHGLRVATDNGLYTLSTSTHQAELTLRFSSSNQSVIDDVVVDFTTDAEGGIWLANNTDGAFYWHPQSEAFQHFSLSDNTALSNARITDVWQQDHILWVSTVNGLNRIDTKTSEINTFLANDTAPRVWHSGNILRMQAHYSDTTAAKHLSTKHLSTLWLSSVNGIHKFDMVSESLQPLTYADSATEQLMGPGALLQHIDTTDGTLLVKQRRAFYKYHPDTGSAWPIAVLNNTAPSTYFDKIVGQLPDNSLILSAADQLWQYDPDTDKLTMLYQTPDYQPQLNRFATSMQLDEQGILWIGMRGVGLLGIDVEQKRLLHTFSVQNKLRNNEVFSLQRDALGDIWFSSRRGLARLQPKTLQIDYFTQADGLPFHEFTEGAVATLNDNRLVYGGIRGIVMVDPEILPHAFENLRVVITDFAILTGKDQPIHGYLNGRTMQLNYADSGLKINFSAMNFHHNHKITYRYWLTGTQNNQYPPQYDSQVIFPQLPPGNYQFNVVAISPVTGAQSEPATLNLVIAAPWWRTHIAYFSYGVLFIIATWLIWRKRREQHNLIKHAHQQVKNSEQRLTQALTSVNSGVFEWQALNNTIVSSRLPRMLGTNELIQAITWQQHCSLIHPDDLSGYQQQWQRLLQQPEQWLDFTYRMRHQNGHWLWFRDRGRVTEVDQQQQPIKVLGTYSNITETKANEEKARLFGEAFQQTRDWVVILDNRQRVIAANQSFCQAFGDIAPYLDSPRSHHLGISLVRRRFYTKLLKELPKGEHWQGEEQVITPDGRERPTLINISAIGEHTVSFFVLVFTDITEQKAAEDELRYLANYDALTGLPNRALLMDRIQHGIEQAKRQERSLALCFIDLDKFKHINDSLGHDIGDLLLKEVARRLKLTLRDSDTVARLGGDEFVVLLEGYKNNNNISHVARKMLAVISEPMQLGPDHVAVSPSIGIAVFPDDALNGTELMKHADVAMYHAKAAGRNNFQFFIKEMNEKAHMQLVRETKLRKAIQKQEFINYYQPIIDSATQQIVGVEVLLRWQSPEGLISPAEFIPLAEELRLIVSMTQQLLERAVMDAVKWRNAGFHLYVSVNLSTQHIEQPALAESVLALLEKYTLSPAFLRFEITESALMRDQQSAIRTMQALSDSGIKLALDDFGTGYSSLKYLKELPLDAIKIDRSFVQDIGIDQNDETIIDAMLSMAGSLGLYCVAEGVETEQQLAFFNKRHCYLIQGFLFSKPLPADAILSLLQAGHFSNEVEPNP